MNNSGQLRRLPESPGDQCPRKRPRLSCSDNSEKTFRLPEAPTDQCPRKIPRLSCSNNSKKAFQSTSGPQGDYLPFRLPDTKEEEYERDKGTAQIHGHLFEYKFCALSYLRARNKGKNFKLASNVEGHGKFDDVFVEYLDNNSRKKDIFVQLKSRERSTIAMKDLLEIKGDFSLRKYYESYIEIGKKFNCSGGVKLEGSIDESLFIIYTNADVGRNLQSNKVTYR